MTLSEQIDTFLTKIHNGELVFLVEGLPEVEYRAIDKALEYELIKKEGDFYRLRRQGDKAIKAGGFDKWEQENERLEREARNNAPISVRNAIIGNNNAGNVQGSSFRDLKATNAIPAENEKQQKAKVSSIEKWIVPIVIAVIAGVILLYIEHKTGFFSGK